MSSIPDDASETPTSQAEAETAARDLRRQLDEVKAHMQEHRETMEAAGLAAPRKPPCTEP
jgi:hypothetical protein